MFPVHDHGNKECYKLREVHHTSLSNVLFQTLLETMDRLTQHAFTVRLVFPRTWMALGEDVLCKKRGENALAAVSESPLLHKWGGCFSSKDCICDLKRNRSGLNLKFVLLSKSTAEAVDSEFYCCFWYIFCNEMWSSGTCKKKKKKVDLSF